MLAEEALARIRANRNPGNRPRWPDLHEKVRPATTLLPWQRSSSPSPGHPARMVRHQGRVQPVLAAHPATGSRWSASSAAWTKSSEYLNSIVSQLRSIECWRR